MCTARLLLKLAVWIGFRTGVRLPSGPPDIYQKELNDFKGFNSFIIYDFEGQILYKTQWRDLKLVRIKIHEST